VQITAKFIVDAESRNLPVKMLEMSEMQRRM
jgi:hypothetical protein